MGEADWHGPGRFGRSRQGCARRAPFRAAEAKAPCYGRLPRRLVRLRHVLGELHAGRWASHAELALACGYSDQPHLVRDFKALTGRTPGEDDAFRNRRLERAQARIVHRHRP